MILRRRPSLPDDLQPAWRAFLECAETVETGRRSLLSTLPAGRVEPAPVGIGLETVDRALDDTRARMPRWRIAELEDHWQRCARALDEAAEAVGAAREVAASTSELEDLLGAVEEVVAPLDAFADAERAWRRRWRVPRPPA